MEPSFWEARWKEGRIGFHASETDLELMTHWASLGVAEGAQVLVPLCGKSLDMLWLREQGYRVLGVELSSIAVEAFFEENGVPFERDGDTWRGDRIELICGDLFGLKASDFGSVRAVYDRAALVALPEDMRESYAGFLGSTLELGTPMLVKMIEYDQSQMQGPPFSVGASEVRRLYGGGLRYEEVLRRPMVEGLERFQRKGVDSVEEVVCRLVSG